MKALKKYIPIIVAAIAFIVVLVFLQPAPASTVVVAARDLPAGHMVVLGDLKLEEVPESLIPENAIVDQMAAVDQTLSVDRALGRHHHQRTIW